MTQDPKLYLEAIKRLPPLMRQILNNEALVSQAITLGEKYHLSPQQETALMEIEREVIAQNLKVIDIEMRIRNSLQIDATLSQQIARDFLGMIILPMEWYLGPVQPLIQKLGGQTEIYFDQAKKNFPEIYRQSPTSQPIQTEQGILSKATSTISPAILENFDDRLTSFKGRAEVLLRLTGLSSHLEEMMKNKQVSTEEGQQLMQQLDSISYAVNTQDLNQFEVQSIKRHLTKVLDRIGQAQA